MNIKFITSGKSKRSSLSCNECRRRKKRCDEIRPSCSACSSRSVSCVYQGKPKFQKQVLKIENTANIVPRTSSPVPKIEDIKASWFDSSNLGSIELKDLSFVIPDSIISESLYFENLGSPYSLDSTSSFDLEFTARSILSNFHYDGIYADKYNHCYDMLLPLTLRSKPILFTLCGWTLSINSDTRAEQFLLESFIICDRLEMKIDDYQFLENDLIDLVVCLTCHTLIASTGGNSDLWKQSFERLYKILKKFGLQEILLMIKDTSIALWVINWFFYQDVLKLIKVTNSNKVGPLFSKLEYRKVLNQSFEGVGDILEEVKNNTPKPSKNQLSKCEVMDPLMGCCMGLYMVLGEVNTVYDSFIVKINGPIDFYYSYIKPQLDLRESDEEKLSFLNTEIYHQYENVRMEFHDWVQLHTVALEKKIKDVVPRISALVRVKNEDKELYLNYFNLLQKTILLFLKIKIKELSSISYEIKQLILHIFKEMEALIGTWLNNNLIFSLLLAGAAVCEPRDRLKVKDLYLKILNSSNSRSVQRVWSIIQEFWNINPDGTTFDLWQNSINKLDWNICII